MGTKQTSQQNQSSSFTPPPEVLANYQAVTSQAQNVAATPYSAYSGPLVAGINSQQNAGIGAVNSASGIQNPANAAATGLTGASAGAINPTTIDAADINQYESPYQNDVINATEAQIQNQNQQQAASLTGSAISSGAFGGDRAGIAQAALAGQQDIASNSTIAGLENQNYSQALGEANTQQGVNLGAQQNTAARQLAAGAQSAQIGQTAQTEALNEANAQTNAGTLQQTTQQAQDTANYNQFLQQQAYPFETTGWLANIVEGIGSQSGGSSTGTTSTDSNSGSQIAGGLLGLASFLARGGRVPRRADGGAMQTPGGIYLPQTFDPTASGPTGIGGGGIVPTVAPLAVGHTMPTQGAPQAPQAPTMAQNAQSMAQTEKAVQGAGNGLKNAYGQLTAPPAAGAPLAVDSAGTVAPTPAGIVDSGSGDMAGLSDAGLGGIFARGGIVRPHFMSGGSSSGRESDNVEDRRGDASTATGEPVHIGSPPRAVGIAADPDKANASLADISAAMGGKGPAWTVPDDAPLNYARGGIAGRRHFLLGGGTEPLVDDTSLLDQTLVPGSSNPDSMPMPQGSPEAPLAAAVQMTVPQMPQQNAPTGVAPNLVGAAAQMAVPAMPDENPAAPLPPVRPADLGVAPDAPTGVATPPAAGGIAAPPQTAPAPDQTFQRMIGIESGGRQFNSDDTTLTSPKGALGVAQVMPGTGPEAAKMAGLPWNPAKLANDPAYNLALGKAYYQNQLSTFGTPDKAAAAYNAGPEAVKSAMTQAAQAGGSYLDYLPKETQAYVANATGNAAPAVAAISAAAPPSGGVAPSQSFQTSSPQFPDHVSTPESGRTGLLGLNLSPETRQLMLSAGLGIMGATGRSFLGNVGTGAASGIAAARSNANLSSEMALRNTQTQGAAIENQLKSTQLKLMMDALNGHADAISTAAANPPSVTTPTVTAPTVAGQTPPAAPKQIDPNFDPVALRALSDRLSMGGPMLKDRADRAAQQAAAIMSGDQQVKFTDGTTGYYPGVAEAKAKQAESVAAAQEAAKVPAALATNAGQKTFETQNAVKSAAFKDAEDGQQMLSQATAMKEVMFDPKTGQPNVNSGPMGPRIATIASLLQQAGVSPNIVKTITGTNPDDAQALEKFRTNLGSESARADLPGSQVRVTEFQRYLQSVPSSEVLPAAFKYLIDNAIIPKAQQQIGGYETVKNMDPSHDNIQDALFEYRKTNPWYKSGVATPNVAAASAGVSGGITPAMAQAEIARRAAARQQQAQP